MTAATIRYLMDEEEMIDEPRTTPRFQARVAPSVSGRPARILVADDDTEMRNLLASSLRGDGYDVVEATSGPDLLEEVSMLLFSGQAVPVDLIISDERMPGMLGSEVLAGLRESRWPTPFVLITGFGDAETHRRAFSLGARAVFDKPFDLDELKRTVETILARG
jgi:CheY-like chemotaxis protein